MADPVTKSIIVKGEASEAYELWADFENFPRFMKNITSVRKSGERASHWVMEGPLGKNIEWDAETTRLEPNKRIAWNSTGGDIQTSGQVTFNPLPAGETEITVTLKYVPPAGVAGEVIASLFGNPEEKLSEDLRNFKAYFEGMTSRIDG